MTIIREQKHEGTASVNALTQDRNTYSWKTPHAEQMILELKGFLGKFKVGKGQRHAFTGDAD